MCLYITIHCLCDVARWTCDRALCRYFDCAIAHVGLCNLLLTPLTAPPRGSRTAEHRRAPPPAHGRLWETIPERPRAHRADSTAEHPGTPANPAERRSQEAAPFGCGDTPKLRKTSGQTRAATIGFGAEPKPGAEQQAVVRETKRGAAIRSRIPRRHARPLQRGRGGDQPPDWG